MGVRPRPPSLVTHPFVTCSFKMQQQGSSLVPRTETVAWSQVPASFPGYLMAFPSASVVVDVSMLTHKAEMVNYAVPS